MDLPPPFSLESYRQLVRNGYEEPGSLDVDHQSGAPIIAPGVGPGVISCIAKTQ